MRTQTARFIELDDASWQLPRVDPTGWLAGGPVTAARPGAPAGPTGHVRPRRPRRTAEARVARELELARRRRHRRSRQGLWRRHGRVLAIGPMPGSRPEPVAGRTDRDGARPPEGWWAAGERGRSPVGQSGRRLVDEANPECGRMGRWERLALTVLVAATLVLVAIRLVGVLIAGPEASMDVTVRPGDTLWSIAADAAPDRDPRAVIDEIRRLNQVTGDLVRAGEVLRVPVSPDRGSAG